MSFEISYWKMAREGILTKYDIYGNHKYAGTYTNMEILLRPTQADI